MERRGWGRRDVGTGCRDEGILGDKDRGMAEGHRDITTSPQQGGGGGGKEGGKGPEERFGGREGNGDSIPQTGLAPV